MNTTGATSPGDERRDSEVRATVPPDVALRVWTKAAGRCVLCASYLLDSRASKYHTTKVGEVAHNVGATTGARSPRGKSPLGLGERAAEQNLLLLCHDCHRMVDAPANLELWTEERLTAKKEEHEARVLRATDFSTLQRTLVVTTAGPVRGERITVADRHVTHALVEEGLVAHVDGGLRSDVVVSLPPDLTKEYAWQFGRDQIDDAVKRIRRTIEGGADPDLSVFAIAPIPLLMYLGSALDDTSNVRLFERHRDDSAANAWAWRSGETRAARTFELTIPTDDSTDALVVEVAVSGTARVGQRPAAVRGLPVARMEVAAVDPAPGVLATHADLDAAVAAWRQVLARIEMQCPHVRTLHVIAAVPASLAVNMGRSRMRGAHPDLVVYELVDGAYIPTPAITDPKD